MGRGGRLLAVRARAGVPRPWVLTHAAARVEGKNGAAVAGLLEGVGAAVAREEGVVVGGGVRVRVLVAEEDGGGGLRREGVVQVADKKEQYYHFVKYERKQARKSVLWIRIRIKVFSWIRHRIRIRISLQMTSKNVTSMEYETILELFQGF
jgi:hypothetical protein